MAKAVAELLEQNPSAQAIVLMQHGLITWGETASESYEKTIELTTKAEAYLQQHARNPLKPKYATSLPEAEKRLTEIAPIVRGLLAKPTGDPDLSVGESDSPAADQQGCPRFRGFGPWQRNSANAPSDLGSFNPDKAVLSLDRFP